jgi:hypothetical protein
VRVSKWCCVLVVTAGLAACVGKPPIEDYILANTAMEAAKAAQAQRIAPGYFSRADDSFHRAVSEYDDRHYTRAKRDFHDAKFFAEQAENFSMLKKAETGDSN